METWQAKRFADAGIDAQFVQENFSQSSTGTLRGLHYQIRQPQGKLVRVVLGEVFDVAVDLRTSSATFGKWVGCHLTAENKRMMWVPEGFAHGFLVISDAAEFLYKTTDYYAPEYEQCIRWDAVDLAIEWPRDVKIILSQKDSQGTAFRDAVYFE